MRVDAAHKLKLALEKRSSLLRANDKFTNAYRLIHSQGDSFDGLTVDKLGPIFLVECHQSWVDPTALIEALVSHFGSDSSIFLKERWSLDKPLLSGRLVRGPKHNGVIEVNELGLRYSLDVCNDEHIGLFLDARVMRKRVIEISKNKRVLNLFCYTGGFGMSAAFGGARSTTNVDNKRSALERAKNNWKLNNLPYDSRTFLKSDAVKFLKRATIGRGRYDLVIVDPPPRFKQSGRNDFEAKTGYARLVARCFSLLEPGGCLMAGLNALTVDDATFREMIEDAAALAGKQIQILQLLLPDKDFPVSKDRPTARFNLVAVD